MRRRSRFWSAFLGSDPRTTCASYVCMVLMLLALVAPREAAAKLEKASAIIGAVGLRLARDSKRLDIDYSPPSPEVR